MFGVSQLYHFDRKLGGLDEHSLRFGCGRCCWWVGDRDDTYIYDVHKGDYSLLSVDGGLLSLNEVGLVSVVEE